MISKKVVLTGSFGVGKTSLFNRFISNTFSDKYLTTIGVKVDKKSMTIEGEEISLILWDIAGEVSQEKVPKSYFLGTSAIIYIFDLSSPTTLKNMQADLRLLNNLLPGVLIRKVGNKQDLVTEDVIQQMKKKANPDTFTSAKTGENVEELFLDIAKFLIS
ncbi:MAG: GTP-binding protein [Saprospiraceae bacterium]|nr:MAG: GTP-binding protein [Saprospiraceae bacterium]